MLRMFLDIGRGSRLHDLTGEFRIVFDTNSSLTLAKSKSDSGGNVLLSLELVKGEST